jgi:hypothetical protein
VWLDSSSQPQPEGPPLKNPPEAKARPGRHFDALVLAREPQLQLPNRLWKEGRYMGDSPDNRRTLAVAPLIPNQRCYGECPVRLRRGPRDARLPGWRYRGPVARLFGAASSECVEITHTVKATRSRPRATLKPTAWEGVATLKPPSGHPQATLRPPSGHLRATSKPRASKEPYKSDTIIRAGKMPAFRPRQPDFVNGPGVRGARTAATNDLLRWSRPSSFARMPQDAPGVPDRRE